MALPSGVTDQGRVAQRHGVAIAIYPGDARFATEVERADDDGGGSPDLGTIVTVGFMSPGQQIFLDHSMGSSPDTFHFRFKHVRDKYDDGTETAWRPFKSDLIPEILPLIQPDAVTSLSADVVDGTGEVTFVVNGSPVFRSIKWVVQLSGYGDPTAGTVEELDVNGDASVNPAFTAVRGQEVFISIAFYGESGGVGDVLGTLRSSLTYGVGQTTPILQFVSAVEGATTATYTVKVIDPDGISDDLYVQTKEGFAAWSGFVLVDATPNHNANYGVATTLTEGHQTIIRFRLRFTIDGTQYEDTSESGGFDKGKIPNITVEPVFDELGNLSANVVGDIDTESIKIKGGTSQPTDAATRLETAKNNRMFNTTDIGTLVATVDIGETVFITAFGYGLVNGGGLESSESVQIEVTRPGSFIPTVEESWTRVNSATSTLDLSIWDPFLRITVIEFNKREGSQASSAYTGFVATWDTSTGTIGVNSQLDRDEAVSTPEGEESIIEWRITYTDEEGTTRFVTGAVSSSNPDEHSITRTYPYTMFHPTNDLVSSSYLDFLIPRLASVGPNLYRGAVALPNDVTITGWGLRGYRDAAGDVVSLQLAEISSIAGSTNIGSILTHATTGWATLTRTGVSVVVDTDKIYRFQLVLDDTGSQLDARFLWATITFTRHTAKEVM